jgi:hypothetical protein
MIRQNLLLVLTTASFVVAYSILAETSLGGGFSSRGRNPIAAIG